jgi:hypothetical protein
MYVVQKKHKPDDKIQAMYNFFDKVDIVQKNYDTIFPEDHEIGQTINLLQNQIDSFQIKYNSKLKRKGQFIRSLSTLYKVTSTISIEGSVELLVSWECHKPIPIPLNVQKDLIEDYGVYDRIDYSDQFNYYFTQKELDEFQRYCDTTGKYNLTYEKIEAPYNSTLLTKNQKGSDSVGIISVDLDPILTLDIKGYITVKPSRNNSRVEDFYTPVASYDIF